MDERWLTRTERKALTKERARKRSAERRALARASLGVATIGRGRKRRGERHRERLSNDEEYALRHMAKQAASRERRKARMKSDPEYAARVREKARIRRKLRREHDPGYDAMIRLRKRLRKVLSGEKKSDSCRRLVGCSSFQLEAHIRSKFLPGMSWENRHLWHIDHIRPCAAFDLSDPAQQAKCFHYTNLQPFWAEDNIRKGARAC